MGIDCTSQDSGGGLGGKLSESRRRVDGRRRREGGSKGQRSEVPGLHFQYKRDGGMGREGGVAEAGRRQDGDVESEEGIYYCSP